MTQSSLCDANANVSGGNAAVVEPKRYTASFRWTEIVSFILKG